MVTKIVMGSRKIGTAVLVVPGDPGSSPGIPIFVSMLRAHRNNIPLLKEWGGSPDRFPGSSPLLLIDV